MTPTDDVPEPHSVAIIVKAGGLARWKCSCGASSGGRWYRSIEEAAKKADRHLLGMR